MDVETAGKIISSMFPDLRHAAITPIAEGGDHDTFDVNGSFIFKFPRTEDTAARQRIERIILEKIRSTLPILVPEFVYVGQPCELFPYPFTGQRKIKGISGEKRRPDAAQLPYIAKTAAQFLSALHSYSSPDFDVTVPEIRLDSPASMVNRVMKYKEWLSRALEPNERMKRYIHGCVRLPEPADRPSVLCHADLKGEHMIVNEQGANIEAVIDWTDIGIADPIVDFYGFVIWLGVPFVKQMLDHYDRPVDGDFLYRVIFYSRCTTLIHLGERLAGESDAPFDLLMAQLRRAFTE